MPDPATPPARDVPDIETAARLFCETWAELAQMLPDEYGCTLTCFEADTLADLYRAVGDDTTADTLLAGHAAHDDPEDSHWTGEPADAR